MGLCILFLCFLGEGRVDEIKGSGPLFILNEALFEFSQPFLQVIPLLIYCFDFSVIIQGLMFIIAKQVTANSSQIELGIYRDSFAV